MAGARTTRQAALTALARRPDAAGSPGPIPVDLLSRTERALRMVVGRKAAQVVLLIHAGRPQHGTLGCPTHVTARAWSTWR